MRRAWAPRIEADARLQQAARAFALARHAVSGRRHAKGFEKARMEMQMGLSRCDGRLLDEMRIRVSTGQARTREAH